MIAKNKEKVNTTSNSAMHSTVSTSENSPYYSFIPASKTTTQTAVKNPITYTLSYQYVKKDMQQTLIISSALLGSALLLFSLIQLQILQLSLFGY